MKGVNGGREEEQEGMSVHSPCKAPLSSSSSLRKVSLLSLSLPIYLPSSTPENKSNIVCMYVCF